MKSKMTALLGGLLFAGAVQGEQYLGLNLCHESLESTVQKLVDRGLAISERNEERIKVTDFPAANSLTEATMYFYKDKLYSISLRNNLSDLVENLKLKYGKPRYERKPPISSWTSEEFHYHKTNVIDIFLRIATWEGRDKYLSVIFECVPLEKANSAERMRQANKERAEARKKLNDI